MRRWSRSLVVDVLGFVMFGMLGVKNFFVFGVFITLAGRY